MYISGEALEIMEKCLIPNVNKNSSNVFSPKEYTLYQKIQNIPAYFDEMALRGLISVIMTERFSKTYTSLIKSVFQFYSSLSNDIIPNDEIFKECKI